MSADTSRTIYLGNVSNDMDPHDILKQVHTGNIESFRIVSDKNCAFLSFVDPAAAQVFYQEHLTKKLIVNNTELRIGWGKASNLSTQLKLQLQGGATRNVYLGGLNENDNEDTIRAKLSCFGPIEQVRVIRDKNIGFVHFLNISSAIKCVAHLPSDPDWKNKKVNYGKDHCADLADQYGAAALSLQNPYAAVAAANGFGFDPYGYGIQAANPNSNLQRTLYFGNIHPEATCEDICNVIRGGNILQIRYLPDRHIAFVTFTDPNIALNVFNHTSTAGLNIRGRKIRVGWGKPSTISNQVAMAIQSGATRNIYIGGIDEKITIEKLREDFAEYGEIEMVNIFKEKNCAFVNFTSITSALTALNSIKSKPDYTELKINFGKDRCGNPWRPTNKTRENNIKKDENETSYSEENNVKSKKTEQNNNENCPNGNKNE
ncbi:uncharacterized protein BX663DRAFT_430715 [Cokeromyces recurvatus]|uniref:uncharacterized protein n=1 Tax=Cokeromyces recurvatus TaxID=90255 RepID=UPI00221EEADB|nr:uncharacterized protein BX663DRAFT_430715 [Cokeromyces recurvatus]KAI7905348.1 hypothetical protein BX663DRAFT_430715 [Cokeromyces recurvatus]